MVLVSGPGAIAGIAILFGQLANQVFGTGSTGMQLTWAVAAIVFFALVNLRGAEWGGRTQTVLTAIKVAGLCPDCRQHLCCDSGRRVPSLCRYGDR